MRNLLTLALAFTAAAFCISCSTNEPEPYSISDPSLTFPYSPDSGTVSGTPQKVNKVYPWEIWVPNKDLDGLPMVNFAIIGGDELAKKGNRAEALAKYQSVENTRLLPQEKEALVFRIASTQLALQKPKEALTVLSDFFTRQNESVDFVSPSFCILLGYAYGHNNNTEQSLAWFSRVNKINSSNRSYNAIATSAAKDFLSRIPAPNFEQTANMWASDDFIRGLISEERALRTQRGVVTSDNQFASQIPVDLSQTTVFSGVLNIGVLLPSTGKYAVLGNNTKNGLDFALSGKQVTDSKGQSLRVELVTRDAGVPGINTPLQVEELVKSTKPTLIIGPLLSEEAVSAADAARQSRVPMITFSKKGSFLTGDGVFRLGATADSQVQSILSKTYDEMNITQYALVYANDANGQEFADSYRKELSRRNAKLIYERSYNKEDSSSFLAIAQELEQHPVQAILFPDNLLAASRFFSNISPKSLSNIKIIGTASWDDAVQLARYSTILNGALFISPFFASSQEENIKSFVTLYKERYKIQPDFLAAQGYDTGVLVLNSLNTALSQNGTFETALVRFKDYAGLTGKISVSQGGEINRKFKLVEFKDGVITEAISVNKANIVMRGNEVITPSIPAN